MFANDAGDGGTCHIIIWKTFKVNVVAAFTDQERATAFAARFKAEVDEFLSAVTGPPADEDVYVIDVDLNPEHPRIDTETLLKGITT
jgi:hypothetical protein